MSGLVLFALLVLPTARASAGEITPGEAEMGLALADLTASGELGLDLEDFPVAEAAPAEPVRVAVLAALSDRDVRRYARESAETAAAVASPGKMGRTGRWMKKHWWVPALVGVAIGVVVLEPFDDDSDDKRQGQAMQ